MCDDVADLPEDPDVPMDFYTKAADFWNGVDPTVDSMLGGLTAVDRPDITGSANILRRFGPTRRDLALDCGSGIGRVTKGLLLPRFKTVDMVDVSAKLLDASDQFIGEPHCRRVGHRYCTSLHVGPRECCLPWSSEAFI